MRSYFSQFGKITHLRLARNRRTGASKHYAFLEFESAEVAAIVQKTMDNYLMFRHILKVRLVAREEVHEQLWRGADRRFRRVPWNRIERTRVARTDREGWGRRVEREEERRKEKAGKVRGLGDVFEAPRVREVESVPVKAVEVPNVVEVTGTAGTAGGDDDGAEKTDAPVEEVKQIAEGPFKEETLEKILKDSSTGDAKKEKRIKDKHSVKVKKSSKKVAAA